MTTSEKLTWGIVLNIFGWLTFVAGGAISISVIGACLGIPMMMIGLPLGILGTIWTYQAHHEKQRETVAGAIQDGIELAKRSTRSDLPQLVENLDRDAQPEAPHQASASEDHDDEHK